MTNFEVTSKASGIHSKLETFDLFYGIVVGARFYSFTDSLSLTLQCENVTASEAKKSATSIGKSIQWFCSDEEFSFSGRKLWQEHKKCDFLILVFHDLADHQDT